jgi:hypothetical protein
MKINLCVGPSRAQQQAVAVDFVSKLSTNQGWSIEIKRYKRQRSIEQNRYLWGVVYRRIIDSFAHDDASKPTSENLHEYWLGECFGWHVEDTLGHVTKRAMKRSSALSTEEFQEFWQFIQRRCIETRGLYIPDPNEASDGQF